MLQVLYFAIVNSNKSILIADLSMYKTGVQS